MKKKAIVASGIAVAAVVALGGGYLWSIANNRTQVGAAVAVVAPMSITISASGSIVADRSTGIYPPTAGTLAAVRVRDGDAVAAGAELAVMAKGPLKLAVAQAGAAHTAARAQLEAVDNGVPGAIERAAADAALAAARSQVTTAAKNYTDYLDEYEDAATEDEQDLMRPTLRTLKTAKVQADAALKAAKAELSRLSTAARVTLARSSAQQAVGAASRALAEAEHHLAAAELTAPFAGLVSFDGVVEKGAGVTPGAAVMTLVDPDRLAFEASVYETDIALVAKGQPATISLDSFAESTFTGKVTRLKSTAQSTGSGTVAFGVTVSFKPGGARLFTGMTGSTDIEVEAIPDALTVPIESVLSDGRTRVVFVLAPAADTVRRQEVTIGASTDTAAQVLSGLKAGDRVVTTGASTLVDGQRVRTD
ncbi:MAG: efflux RND transporter periplasmic adaptor subunit [Propionicimonas sp.]